MELTEGTEIKLLNGKTCTIDSELGRGGQGIVYLVDYCGGDYALKWYTKEYSDDFYENLKSNANAGAPSKAFLWPLAVTERQYGSFGYVMPLRPRGYREFGEFMLAKTHFSSMAANIHAALCICDAFQKLHIRGLSYQDMNDGNFFINPKSGDVLICDNDNVAPDRTNLGIIGKAGYLAPEIVDRQSMPNRYSDYFSMAVILFILFYYNRPFEGKKYASCSCMTEDLEKELFGHNAVFIMDPSDDSNRPVEGLHTNVIRRWGLFPQFIESLFVQAFSRQAILFPEKRIIDREWMTRMIQLRSVLGRCPHCNEETFIVPDVVNQACVDCEMPIPKPMLLKVDQYRIPLFEGQKIYNVQLPIEGDLNAVVGEVVRNTVTGRLGIKNYSSFTWQAVDPIGSVHNVAPEAGMPIKNEMKIKFRMGINALIVR
ncbi:serine/threonine protein kinase [Millionella massiliensis]|uniref:serine/threonine protein kinase n=1 Tax=Millionella massiliensis TaxID=1871023 RepID=UPI0008DADE04|nr:serine/threonine-protein kinase [Millionella massiliensis]